MFLPEFISNFRFFSEKNVHFVRPNPKKWTLAPHQLTETLLLKLYSNSVLFDKFLK